jgi:hypothetical protein
MSALTCRDCGADLRSFEPHTRYCTADSGETPAPLTPLETIAGLVNGYHNGHGVDPVQTLRQIADVLAKPMEPTPPPTAEFDHVAEAKMLIADYDSANLLRRWDLVAQFLLRTWKRGQASALPVSLPASRAQETTTINGIPVRLDARCQPGDVFLESPDGTLTLVASEGDTPRLVPVSLPAEAPRTVYRCIGCEWEGDTPRTATVLGWVCPRCTRPYVYPRPDEATPDGATLCVCGHRKVRHSRRNGGKCGAWGDHARCGCQAFTRPAEALKGTPDD